MLLHCYLYVNSFNLIFLLYVNAEDGIEVMHKSVAMFVMQT